MRSSAHIGPLREKVAVPVCFKCVQAEEDSAKEKRPRRQQCLSCRIMMQSLMSIAVMEWEHESTPP